MYFKVCCGKILFKVLKQEGFSSVRTRVGMHAPHASGVYAQDIHKHIEVLVKYIELQPKKERKKRIDCYYHRFTRIVCL